MPVPGLAPTPTLRPNEALLLDALRHNLPDGWVVDVQADAEMTWSATVYRASTLGSGPQFTICAWSTCVGLIVHWMDGSAFSAATFAELEPILDLISNVIFMGALARLETAPAGDWDSTRH